MTRDAQILDSFDHHNPTTDQVERIQLVRNACKHAASVLLLAAPSSVDRTVALRKLHEAMMTANKAIVLEGVK